jgi:predicted GIY-YIG superfamily endonuclease
MHYVYLLESSSIADRRYSGVTSDLGQRLKDHNQGMSSHTAKFLPWRLVTYIAFSDEQKAIRFERYLKSGAANAKTAPCGAVFNSRCDWV